MEKHRQFIIAALKPIKDEIVEPNSPDVKSFEFDDEKKFWKYLTSDCIHKISKECDAWFIDTYEDQYLYPDKLPIAIEIISKAVKQKKNADFADYLLKTKELMELALDCNTFFIFSF